MILGVLARERIHVQPMWGTLQERGTDVQASFVPQRHTRLYPGRCMIRGSHLLPWVWLGSAGLCSLVPAVMRKQRGLGQLQWGPRAGEQRLHILPETEH